MRNQRRTKQAFSKESIERALVHHSARGSVDTWKAPDQYRHWWVVAVPGFDAIELTDKEAWAFCVGLAAADRAAQPRVLREIGKDMGPILLRYSRPEKVHYIAAGGGPCDDLERLEVYCPLCHCNKSGSVNHCNVMTDACVDERCMCHEEDWPT